jgi:hypothetical protein
MCAEVRYLFCPVLDSLSLRGASDGRKAARCGFPAVGRATVWLGSAAPGLLAAKPAVWMVEAPFLFFFLPQRPRRDTEEACPEQP